MAIQWSGLGPELLLRLDRDSGQPLRSQLEDGIRDAIRNGRLQSGERLPSSRELARDLGVSRGLVQGGAPGAACAGARAGPLVTADR